MFPPRFDYVAPESLEEALSVLDERGDDAKVMSGGQSLIPLLKLRFASPDVIVDLNRVPGLDGLEQSNGELRIGALVRNSALEDSDLLGGDYQAMADAAPLISDPLIRNMGTLVGSLAHCDPAGDWGAVMLALGGEVVAQSSSGERTIPVDDFLKGPFTTDLAPNEIATEVRVPKPSGSAGSAYRKLERKVGDFATVGAAVAVEVDGGKVSRAGIGFTVFGPRNVRASAADESLFGADPGEEAAATAGNLAAEAAEPQSDHRGSTEYKRQVVREFVTRGLRQSFEMTA
ncbi:MAG: FAD binding domain-containing protein [Solirubrobacterales bacterium]